MGWASFITALNTLYPTGPLNRILIIADYEQHPSLDPIKVSRERQSSSVESFNCDLYGKRLLFNNNKTSHLERSKGDLIKGRKGNDCFQIKEWSIVVILLQ